MKDREQQVLAYLSKHPNAICEEIAYFYEGEGKQSLFTKPIFDLIEDKAIRYTGQTRMTSNGNPALVFKLNTGEEKGKMVDFRASKHSSEIRVLTFEEALYIQENLFNDANRDVSPRGNNVRVLSAVMSAGEFYPNSTLQFSKEGVLIDGHNRITAQVVSKTDQVYNIQTGCEMSWVTGVDVGKRRSASDTAQMQFRLKGRDMNRRESSVVSAVAQHFIGNKGRRNTITLTGTGAHNHDIAKWIDENEDFMVCFLDFLEKSQRDIVDFREATVKSSAKRAIICAFADMYDRSSSFTEQYARAVFGRHTEGVFGGTTPEAVKTLYKTLTERYESGKIRRESVETGVYSALSSGHNLLKECALNPSKGERYMNLAPNSRYLLRKREDNESSYQIIRPE